MNRGVSVLAQISALMLAALIAVLLISFGVVLLTPTPQPERMTVAQAAAALKNPDDASLYRMTVRVAEAPPAGRESPLITSALARQLRRELRSVHASWVVDPATASQGAGEGQTVMVIAGQDVVVDAREGGFTLRSGAIASVAPGAQVPPFRAALRRADGRWLIAQPDTPFLASWRLRMLAAFVLSGLLLAPFVWLVARRLTRPMRALARAAERTQLDRELVMPSEGPLEVRAAAAAMRSMHRRLSAEAAERTRMLAALAHDLRTPLTGIRIRAEHAPEAERGRLIADVNRISAMITQLLDYARGREACGQLQQIDVTVLASGLVREFFERGQPVELGSTPQSLLIEGDPEALRRALENLIENAVRYAGNVTVSVGIAPAGVSITVEDDGPGLPEAEIARVVEPFERLDHSRSRTTGGVGLGLAIARDVAVRHRGCLQLKNKPGSGLCATLVLERM